MARPGATIVAVIAMIALIVLVDVTLFRQHFWPRLMANVAIVLLCGALYLRFRTPG